MGTNPADSNSGSGLASQVKSPKTKCTRNVVNKKAAPPSHHAEKARFCASAYDWLMLKKHAYAAFLTSIYSKKTDGCNPNASVCCTALK
ncbi:MAG TPA: hypothetical protein VHB73_02965 [Alphaproteobacteria bacterium]|nr:hypothetical protein [Alphaproteobacteria bacterium]